LKLWIDKGEFFLTAPVERLSIDRTFKPMKQTQGTSFVSSVMHDAVTCTEDEEIQSIAIRIVTNSVNHIIVIDEDHKLRGIVTSWDITKALAEGKNVLSSVVSRRVETTKPEDPLETASRKMAQHNISALPVINRERKVLGIVTVEDVSRLLGK
ncbi:CBS domain-containing protein, partial [Candidatus Bathyarchaeota archaeon]|nr:CBS domain-containing protein [Candidatus Bathyarchaeota archaeon]